MKAITFRDATIDDYRKYLMSICPIPCCIPVLGVPQLLIFTFWIQSFSKVWCIFFFLFSGLDILFFVSIGNYIVLMKKFKKNLTLHAETTHRHSFWTLAGLIGGLFEDKGYHPSYGLLKENVGYVYIYENNRNVKLMDLSIRPIHPRSFILMFESKTEF